MKRIELLIPDGLSAARADRVLGRLLPDIPAALLREAFRKRDIKRNGTRIAPGDSVRAGDAMCLFLPDNAESGAGLSVIMEDEDFLIIDKRQGIPVQGPASLEAQCAAHTHAPVYACHRLDVQTGGLVLLAKTERAEALAREAFAARKVGRAYRALVKGIPSPAEATLHAYLLKDARASKVYVTDAPRSGAVPIVTRYRVLDTDRDIARLEIDLTTGKTHQIRAHMAHIGHPVLGDDKYGDKALNRAHGKRRQCLCSVRLSLWDGRVFEIPEHF